MRVEEVYRRLTQVDIAEQKQIWDERGKGYYGEYCVFRELLTNISGNCKFLMNLQIPAGNGHTTEIDLVMIHETGVYVFEVKHYKGVIYGKTEDAMWTQFFQTTENSVFGNPVRQNDYHIQALRQMFPSLPVLSVVVFSNDNCTLRVTNNRSNLIITPITNMMYYLQDCISRAPRVFSIEGIEQIFTTLAPYSPKVAVEMADGVVQEVPMHMYLGELKIACEETINEYEKRNRGWIVAWILTAMA